MKYESTGTWGVIAPDEIVEQFSMRENALEAARYNDYGGGQVYVGSVQELNFTYDEVSDIAAKPTDAIVDALKNLVRETLGEIPKTWNFSDDYKAELRQEISKTVFRFLREEGLLSPCSKIVDREEVRNLFMDWPME